MDRHLRTTVFFTVLIIAGSCIQTGVALAATAPGCASPVDSALNQYCDSVPTSTGAQAPQAGTPSLATTLTPRIVTRIEGAVVTRIEGAGVIARAKPGAGGRAHRRSDRRALAQRKRTLLSLPAPGPRLRLLPSRVAIAGGSLIPPWLALVLAGLAVAMAAVAVTTRYRKRHDG